MSKLRWTIAFIIAAATSHAAYAQVLYGSLTGNVFDPSSATIPNAKVEALNTNTGAVRNAIQRKPDVARYHHALALILEQQNRRSEAAAEFRETLKYDPANADARTRLDKLGAPP